MIRIVITRSFLKRVETIRNGGLRRIRISGDSNVASYHVSAKERREAIHLLRAISPDSGFAYYPNVLCSLNFALEGIDPMALELVEREMNEKYYDVSEWITIQNEIIPTKKRENWFKRTDGSN